MLKKTLCLLMCLAVFFSMAGCSLKSTTTSDVWSDVYVSGETGTDGNTSGDPTDTSGSTGGNTSGNKNNSKGDKNNSSKGDNASGTAVTRPTRKPQQMLTYTPVAESGANYDVKGTVTIAVNTASTADYEAMFDVMQQLYPNVKIKYDYYSISEGNPVMEYLTTRSATGKMADIIVYDTGVLPTKIMQGWVYPITKLFNADPNKGNVSDKLVKDYTYCGELYALPTSCSFDCEVFNVDLLNKLGMKAPGLTWTWDDYEKYLRAAASKYSSGLCVAKENTGEVATRYAWWLSMCANGRKDNRFGQWGYDLNTNQVVADYLVKGAKEEYRWPTIMPGVSALYENTQKDSSGKSRLEVNMGMTNGLWEAGKVLVRSTNTGGINATGTKYNFKYKICPTPNTNGQVSMHVDCCYMTTAVKPENVEAAYQLLRFMTFSDNGNLARLTMYEDSQKGKYKLNSRIYYPATTSKVVLDKFSSLSVVTDVDKYFVENIPNASRFDVHKLVPNMYETFNKYVGTQFNTTRDGRDDGSGMYEAIATWNTEIKKQLDNMNTQIQKVQKEFNATH